MAAALLTAVPALMVVAVAGPAAAVAVPYEGVSVYITTNSPANLYTVGCQMGSLDLSRPGTQHSLVVLEFGGQTTINGVWGATLYGGPNSTNAQVLAAVKEYAHGYWLCTGSDVNSVAEVALGTNNSNGASTVTYASGQSWAGLVNSFASWLGTVAYGNQVVAAGSNDIEPGFGDPGPARSWVDGYASVFTRRLVNNGSADGCPTNHIPGSTECGTSAHPSWGPEDIYHVSWGSPPAWPLPEIYRTDGAMAQQWYWLARYALQSHGGTMYFTGSTTQWRSCQTRSCSGLNNTVAAGYTQLYNALAQHSGTAQTPPHADDFKWYGDAG